MKIIIFTILIAAITFNTNAQTPWEAIPLNNKISVSFPGKPEKTQNEPTEAYFYKTGDSTTMLNINIIHLSQLGVDSTLIAEGVEEDEFWESFVKQQLFNSFKEFISSTEEKVTFLGMTGRKYELESKNKENEPFTNVSLITFFMGTKFYIFSFNNIKGKANLKDKDFFFNSIKLTN